MIHTISFKNFYSFADEQECSFVVGKGAPDTNAYFSTPSGARLTKTSVVIGPNASGKTTALKVIPLLKWFIVDAWDHPPEERLPILTFFSPETRGKSSELEVNFEINGSIYQYFVALKSEYVQEERLKIKSKTKKNFTSKTLFHRVYNESNENKYDVLNNVLHIPVNVKLRTNASILGTGYRAGDKICEEITKFWKGLETNVGEEGWAGTSFYGSRVTLEAFDFFSNEDNKAFKEKAEGLFRKFDLGVKNFKLEKETKENGRTAYKVNFKHNFGGYEEDLPFVFESAGTKMLIPILHIILRVLSVGGIAVIDEFDASLHPEILLHLVGLFNDKEENPHNAQLLFSTHSFHVLNVLDKYQIFLTEKNKKGTSEVWRLDEVEGVRSDDNYFAKYMAGAYRAVPNIE